MTEIQHNPLSENLKKEGIEIDLGPDAAQGINGVRSSETGEIYIGPMKVFRGIAIATHEGGHGASENMTFTSSKEESKRPMTFEEASKATIALTDEEKALLRKVHEEKLSLDDLYWEEESEAAIKSVISKLISKYTKDNYHLDPEKIHFASDEEVAKKALGRSYDAIKSGVVKKAIITYSKEARNEEAAAMQVEHGCMTILENTLKDIGIDYTYVSYPSESPSHDRAKALVNKVWKKCGSLLSSGLDKANNNPENANVRVHQIKIEI